MEGSSSTVKNGSQIPSSTMSKPKDTNVPIYMKYARTATQSWLDPSTKLRPSDLVKPSLDINPEDYPLIVEFNNVLDHTSQFHSDVDLDQPIFQPAPRIIVFEDYKPYSTIQRKIFFRNKDTVRSVL